MIFYNYTNQLHKHVSGTELLAIYSCTPQLFIFCQEPLQNILQFTPSEKD